MKSGADNMKDPYEMFMQAQSSCGINDKCEKKVTHYVDVSVPVDIVPTADVGKTVMECCGDPEVVCEEYTDNNVCSLVLIQKIRLKIPVCYSFTAVAGKQNINCCKNCGE